MACKSCAERRERMKAYLAQKLERAAHWAKVRAGNANTRTRASAATDGTQAPAKGAGQAGKASAEHQQRGVEGDQAAGAAEGRVPVQGVRKARGRKAGAR